MAAKKADFFNYSCAIAYRVDGLYTSIYRGSGEQQLGLLKTPVQKTRSGSHPAS
jgi:hypothetical protein